MKKFLITFVALFCVTILFAQTTVSGTVNDANTNDPLPGVNIKVVGTSLGTSTDFDGNFTLDVSQSVPFSMEVTFVGYLKKIVEITEENQKITISISENATSLDEIVVSASRTPESVRESPVTIERMGLRELKSTSSPSFYESLENLKGVDVNKGSLTFSSINTRGFATFANTRFVQLIDGMDNASPALNFVMGNLVGINELDVKSVEIIPGASSALYGANAFNGILFMTSRSPFDDQGISVYLKTGLTVQEAAGDNQFYDFGLRAAHAFSDKFAAKVSFSYLQGTDWFANDTNMYSNVNANVGEPDEVLAFGSSPAHDAINIYGDEVALFAGGTNLNEVAQALEAAGILPPGASNLVPAINVGRTGYREQDLTDYSAESVKFDASFNYRPFGNDLEIVWNSRVGFGSTIYQGLNRYQLKNFLMKQNKIEIRNDDFFIRGYTTSEDAGDSYDMRFTGINMARDQSTQWFGTYAAGYVQAVFGGANDEEANIAARQFADNFSTGVDPETGETLYLTPRVGSNQFNTLFEDITNDPDLETGSKFIDKTKMYVGEGNYNFSSLLNDKMDIQVGGSYRQYSLNSGGTIFTDYDGPIEYGEYGIYAQWIDKFLDDRLRLSASIRYDKNEFFDGNFSPRASVVYSAGDARNHNFRASFQSGFRNPTTQDLFIGLNAGRAILVGSSPENLDRILPGTTLTGAKAYTDSYTLSSVNKFSGSLNPADLVAVNTDLVHSEKVQAFDAGYRGVIGKISIDISGYYSMYDGFISNTVVVTPISGTTADISGVIDLATGNVEVFQLYTNSNADIASYGASIGLNTRVFSKLDLGLSYTYAKLDFDQEKDPDFTAGFNTPEHKFKASVGSANIFKNLGFNVNLRWVDEYLWQATIANAVIPSRTVVDAQINYTVPKIKSMFKIGVANLSGVEYQSAVGSPFIGSQYFVSWVINQ
ncbi:MAG: TonB-dependent receptor [Flavobacteriaceae bacterium]|nr:TonB-dependent receptor [Flavobacteriaceae bacterium]